MTYGAMSSNLACCSLTVCRSTNVNVTTPYTSRNLLAGGGWSIFEPQLQLPWLAWLNDRVMGKIPDSWQSPVSACRFVDLSIIALVDLVFDECSIRPLEIDVPQHTINEELRSDFAVKRRLAAFSWGRSRSDRPRSEWYRSICTTRVIFGCQPPTAPKDSLQKRSTDSYKFMSIRLIQPDTNQMELVGCLNRLNQAKDFLFWWWCANPARPYWIIFTAVV